MTEIGKPVRVIEAPAPVDVPGPEPAPVEKPVEKPAPVKVPA